MPTGQIWAKMVHSTHAPVDSVLSPFQFLNILWVQFRRTKKTPSSVCFCLDQPNLPHFSNQSKGDIRKLTSSILLAYLKDPKKKQGSHSYGSPFQNLTDYFGQMFLQQSGDYLYQKKNVIPRFHGENPYDFSG